MPGFIPDFTDAPLKVSRRQHTLLGDIRVEDYAGIYGDNPIVWSLAQDAEGRVWVDNIRLAANEVSSYGTYKTVLNAGCITSKPFDYLQQTSGLQDGESARFNVQYADITPLLSRLLPIRRFKQAKGL